MLTNPFLETHAFLVLEVEDPRFEIRALPPAGHRALFSRWNFQIGDVIQAFSSSQTLAQPDRYTLQAAANRHIVLAPEFLLYLNHHCRPNCFFDLPSMQLCAVAPIRAGDELTFFYPSTEWAMSEPFDCLCGSAHCHRRIQGAAYLSTEALKSYHLARHIRDLLRVRRLAACNRRKSQSVLL